MEIRHINDDFAVADQISANDVAEIASRGFKTIVCNRPDDENGAVPHIEIRRAAQLAGLIFHYVPLAGGSMDPLIVDQMSRAMDRAEKPILAYCRTGQRCIYLHGAAITSLRNK